MIEDIAGNDAVRLPHAVTVVIPAFNEGAHVADQVREVERVLATTGWTYEIIVVDDGSRDNTAAEADRTGALVLRRLRNRGYGAALKLGISRAAHPWILITDADGTYPVEAIPGLLAEADANEMVIGGRLGANVNIPLARRPAKWFLNKLAGYLAGQPLPDINSGLRLMRRSLVARYEHLLPEGFSFTTTITLCMLCYGKRVVYTPIEYGRRIGSSKIRPMDFFNFILLVLRVVTLFNPLRVFLPLGAILFGLGLAKLAYDITVWNLSETAVFAFLGSILVWSLGLIADMISRLHMRP